nr:retrotransposon protein, putative, Ty3-gypsy subclass [Tanacetum cinerariifolium]
YYPVTRHFTILCTDSSDDFDSSDAPPPQDPYMLAIAHWRSKVASHPSSSSEYPIAHIVALSGTRRPSATLVEVDLRDDREEYEANVGDTFVLRIESRSVLRVDKEIVELVGGDSSSSSGTRDGTVRTMTNTRSGMTPVAIEEVIHRRVTEALEAHEINRNLGLENLNRNSNDGNGNYNGNGENDSVKRWKQCFTSATIQKDIRELMKLMIEVYCPRNEIQKMETEMRNLTVKNNDMDTYTQRSAIAVTTQETRGPNQRVVTCFECGAQGHYRKDCPKVKNQNHLGSFDVIIVMDWLVKNHDVIVCDEKIVRIPYENKILIVQGDICDNGKKSTLIIISCVKAQKYMEKGCQLFLAVHGFNEPGMQAFLDKFIIVFIDDILIYLRNKVEHEGHLKQILKLLKKEELYAKFSKCDFWLSKKLCSASILALPKGSENFMVYYDASHKGLGAFLMQREKVIAYASRQLKIYKKNYTTYDLELGVVVFALKM